MTEATSDGGSGDEGRVASGWRWTISLRRLLILTTMAGFALAWGVRWRAEQETQRRQIVPVYWDLKTGENVLWSTKLGSQSYSSPVVANGRVFIGSNNGAEYDARYVKTDMGVMLCFDADTGKFLWQLASEKLPEGRVRDWPEQGVCGTATVEGQRLWYMNNRAQLCCLDTEGFLDNENDGEQNESRQSKQDADVVWMRDLIQDFGVSPHNMSCGGCVTVGNRLFFVAPNGVDESHRNLPAPEAAAFICLDKRTGELIWQDHSSSPYLIHGQWSTPATARLGGAQQVLFPGGDGWLYSFAPQEGADGKPQLLWKFDCNPKDAIWDYRSGTRSNLIQAPTIHDGKVLIAVGQDPEHGEGPGRVLCIDPTKRGDVSEELVVLADGSTPAPRRRYGEMEDGEQIIPNPNSALAWKYTGAAHDSRVKWEVLEEATLTDSDQSPGQKLAVRIPKGGEQMHRTISKIAAKGDWIVAADIAGFVHCLDAKTGVVHWVHDMWASTWSSPIIAGKHIYIGNEDGVVLVYGLSADPAVAMKAHAPLAELEMPTSIYASLLAQDNVLYIPTRSQLFAIRAADAK